MYFPNYTEEVEVNETTGTNTSESIPHNDTQYKWDLILDQ